MLGSSQPFASGKHCKHKRVALPFGSEGTWSIGKFKGDNTALAKIFAEAISGFIKNPAFDRTFRIVIVSSGRALCSSAAHLSHPSLTPLVKVIGKGAASDRASLNKAFSDLPELIELGVGVDSKDPVCIVEGNICDFEDHKCPCIVSAASTTVQFQDGLCEMIRKATNPDAIDKEALDLIRLLGTLNVGKVLHHSPFKFVLCCFNFA